MDVLTCIYMYCNIENNIMKNQSSSSGFVIQGKIFVHLFCVSRHYIFFQFLRIHLQVISV